MISPIGSFLTRMDSTLSGSMDNIIAAMTSAMAAPIAAAAVCYYGVQGLRLANGDSSPLQNFVPQLIRVGAVIWLSSNLTAFNQWVRAIFFTGLPNALSNVVTGGLASGIPDTISGTAAAFDNVYNQLWAVIGMLWMQVGFSVTGVLAAFTGVLAALFGSLGLVYMAVVYLG